MTHVTHDPGSIQDLTFELAQDRIAGLRASAPAQGAAEHSRIGAAETSRGIVARSRDALGRRLIALGGSLVADESLRRGAMHR